MTVGTIRYVALTALVALTTVGCTRLTNEGSKSSATRPATQLTGPMRWEAEIAKFEAADNEKMPEKNGIVFVGSSTIRMWDVNRSFPALGIIHRGFGGSQTSDMAYFARRIVTKYQPRLVVTYEGDNDIGDGKTPEQVVADYKRFADTLHQDVPAAKLMILGIKPSIRRWSKIGAMREANKLLRNMAERSDWITFVDTEPMMLDEHGQPRKELFKADCLHMNDEGYKLWSDKIRPLLTADVTK
jgi:lysophospholipase L1-like esterase